MIYERCPWGRFRPNLKGKFLSVKEKKWLGSIVARNARAAYELADRYHLHVPTLQKYGRMVKQNLTFHTPTGRPEMISALHAQEVVEKLKNTDYLQQETDYEQFLQAAANATLYDRTGSNTPATTPSRRTQGRFEKKYNITAANAEVATDARAIATSSVRNTVSFATMNALVQNDYSVHPSLKLNADATAFTIGSGCNKTQRVKLVRDSVPANRTKKTRQPVSKRQTLPYTLKVYVLISAGGTVTAPVYIIPDEAMDKDDIEPYNVPGLGFSTDVNSHGFVVFMKSRAGNASFYEWYHKAVLFPFVQELRTANGLSESDWCYFQLDGDDEQIKVYRDPKLREDLLSHHIVAGKPPGSTSEITQPCDRKNVFRGPKGVNRGFDQHPLQVDAVTQEKLDIVFQLHALTLKLKAGPASTSTSNAPVMRSKVGPEHQRQAKDGIARVQAAFQRSVQQQTIRESFAETGVEPLDLHKIFADCRGDISVAEEESIMKALPSLMEKMRKQGELLDADFDKFRIRNLDLEQAVGKKGQALPSRLRKDGLVIGRRRSVLLTHTAVVTKESSRIAAREAKNAVAIVKRAERVNKKRNKDVA